jgi:hypothetical protein
VSLPNNLFASACVSLLPIIAFGTCHLPSSSWPLALPPAHRRFELIPPHFLGAISGSQNRGALMRQIISSVYGALLIAIWLCVMGTVIAVLDSGEPKWLLVVAGFVAATITVTLVEEFIGWRSRPTKSALEQRST